VIFYNEAGLFMNVDSHVFDFMLFQTLETWDLYFDWKIDQRSFINRSICIVKILYHRHFQELKFSGKVLFWVLWKCKLPRVNGFELCNMDCFRELIFLIKEGLVKEVLVTYGLKTNNYDYRFGLLFFLPRHSEEIISVSIFVALI